MQGTCITIGPLTFTAVTLAHAVNWTDWWANRYPVHKKKKTYTDILEVLFTTILQGFSCLSHSLQRQTYRKD